MYLAAQRAEAEVGIHESPTALQACVGGADALDAVLRCLRPPVQEDHPVVVDDVNLHMRDIRHRL